MLSTASRWCCRCREHMHCALLPNSESHSPQCMSPGSGPFSERVNHVGWPQRKATKLAAVAYCIVIALQKHRCPH